MISAWLPGPLLAATVVAFMLGAVGWAGGSRRFLGWASAAIAWALGAVLLFALAVAILAGLTR